MKVFVAGHSGLAGSALCEALKRKNYELITADRNHLDLCNAVEVDLYFKKHLPDWVFIAAATVGGIQANLNFPVHFLLDNLKIQNNLIETSFRYKVQKLLFLGSNCMYPKLANQPLKEETLLTGSIEKSNEPYAVAKIAGIKLCNAYNRQYGTDYVCVVPTTLYGPNDNYHPENGHVLPMLMRRFHEAKIRQDKSVTIWGTGTPIREFLHTRDMAEACLQVMEKSNAIEIGEMINIGSGQEISILELAHTLKKVIQLDAEIILDTTKPDGAPRKQLDSTRIFSMGWKPQISFFNGLQEMYSDFLNNPQLRK